LYIKDAILRKIDKAQNSEFQKFKENWLLIYDNTPSIFMHKELLIPYIKTLSNFAEPEFFDRIFIETSWLEESQRTASPVIVAISLNDIEYMHILDVW
jgi:hypothetical protein